jgi:hypothetical protein
MSKTLAIMLTATLAVAIAAVTTTMQIQPAYSQTSHCVTNLPPGQPSRTCVTPGNNPTTQTCTGGQFINCGPLESITGKQAGQAIGQQHRDCAQGVETADVCTPPTP